MSSMGIESIMSWSDSAFPTATSSILEPIRWVLKQGGLGRLEIILLGLAGLKFSLFLRDNGTELITVFAFELPTTRFEWLSADVLVKIGPLLSPLYLRLGEGDLSVLLGREYAGLGLSGSLRKLFWRARGVGELDRTLFFGGIDCFAGAAIGFAVLSVFWAWSTLVGASGKAFSLSELMRTMWGFSLMHDHKKSLENDLSFEPKTEDAVLDSELAVVALLVVHVREEVEEVEVVGEGGEGEILFLWEKLGVFGACEITSLSWTRSNSSGECFLGLHLLMQEPIWRILIQMLGKF